MPPLTARQLASVSAVSDHDVNPRTGDLALTWNASGVPAIYSLPATGGEPRLLTSGKGQYATWAPDGRRLVFLRDESGAEADDLILFDTRTNEARNLTSDTASYMWPRFAPDGRFAVISNRDDNFDPYTLDLMTGAWQRLVTGERAARSLVWSPSGRWLGFARQDDADVHGNIQFAMHLYDTTTGQVRHLASLGGDFFEVEWSWEPTDGEPHLCLSADHGEFQDLLRLSIHGDVEWLTSGEGDKFEPQWSPDGRWLAYGWGSEGNVRLLVLDSCEGQTRDVSIGAGVHRQPRWAPDGRSLTVRFESATRPPDLWRVALTGQATQLTHSLPLHFPADALTDSQSVHFPSFDGRAIHGLLYAPAEPNGVAIVWVHGGPTASHRNQWHPDVQGLTSHGYTVLAPNVRGSTGYGRAFRDLNRLDWGGGDLADLAAAHCFLRKQGFERIGVTGGSYGGYLTLMALTKQPDLWAAGAALFPIANLRTLYESSRPSDLRPYLVDQIGRPDERPDFYDDRSPVHFVEQVRAPLLLLQGANDIRTPLTEAESMAERLAATGKAHTFHVYPNEGHGFMHRETRADALRQVRRFFNDHLTCGQRV